MIKKIFRKLVTIMMKNRGYSSYFGYRVFKEQWNDIFNKNSLTLREKFWAQKRGFLSDKIVLWGLTEENYKDFISDFDYYKLHPINGVYGHWIDDKLTTKLILKPFSEFFPEYYYHICDQEILRLSDCPSGYQHTIDDIDKLLRKKHDLAAKLASGSLAKGFFKLSYMNNSYFLNDKKSSKKDFYKLINTMLEIKEGGYLITEYIHTNSELGKIWNKTPNKLRSIVVREKYKPARLMASFFSFGTSDTGVIDNATAGGVACFVDVETGFFSKGIIYKNNKITQCKYHPDTNQLIEGKLPHWDLIKEKIIEISDYLPELRYMGFDIVITDAGFKILEINSHSGLKFTQHYTPVFRNELSKDFFIELLMHKKK